MKLRIRRPAPTSSTQANAISDTTSAPRTQLRPPVDPRLASFSAPCSAASGVLNAGARPKRMPVPSAIASVKASDAASVWTLASSGILTASSRASARVPAIATASPSSAPLHDNTIPSVSICATSRPRPAPSAVRIAISFCRAALRARSRFERFAHTISITTATAPARTQTAARIFPLTWSESGETKPSKEFLSGCSRVSAVAMVCVSACACAAVTPGLRRPIIAIVLPQRLVSGASANGKYRSKCVPGANTDAKSNDAGRTPMTVVASSFSVSDDPTTAGSDAKRRVHRPWLRRTAFGPFHFTSSAVNVRPSAGCTPRIWKKLSDTGTALSRSGSPRPVSIVSPTP